MKSETRTTLSERDALVLLSSGSFRFVPLTNETGREAFIDASDDALIAFDEKSGVTFLLETDEGKTVLSVYFGDGYYFETFTLSNESGTVRGVRPPAPAFRSLPEKPITGEIRIGDLTPAETALRAATNDEPEPGDEEDGENEERLSAFDAFELLISGDTSSVTVSEGRTGAVYVRDGLDEENGQRFVFSERSPLFKGETSLEIFSRLSSGSLSFRPIAETDFGFSDSYTNARVAFVNGLVYIYGSGEEIFEEDSNGVRFDILDPKGSVENIRSFTFSEVLDEEDARDDAREDARAALAPSPGSTLSALSIDALSLLARFAFRPLTPLERAGFAGASDAALICIEPDTNERGEETDEGNLWIFDPGAEGGARLECFNLLSEGEFFFVIESVYESISKTDSRPYGSNVFDAFRAENK